MSEDRIFESNGMLFNEGDIPECSYCGNNYDYADTLHETPFSGGLCCEKRECRENLLNDILDDQVRETTDDEN